MAIQFVCPYGHRLKVPDHRAGKKGRCPKCHQRVIVPVPNPIPSGKEKKPWNATTGEGFRLDDEDTPGFSDDDILDNPFLENLLENINSSQPKAGKPAEPETPPKPVEAELELPPEISTFAAEAAPQTEPPPSPPAPAGENFEFLRDMAEPPGAEPPGAESPEAESPEAESPEAGAFEDLPEIITYNAPPDLPPAPPKSEQSPSEISIVRAPPPVTLPPTKELGSDSPAANSSPATAQPNMAPNVALPRWVARARAELTERSYRPNPQQIENVYWLALVLLFVIVFTSAPALGYLRLDEAPRWAQAMLLVAGLQAAYAAWLAIVPDWSTVKVGMWLFAASAFAYAAASGMYGMSGGAELPLELSGSRTSAAGWCGANSLVLGLMSYACGQVCVNWRRADSIAYSASRRSLQT